MNVEQARFNMIEQQIRPWDVLNSEVLEVLATVPRERFAPVKYRNLAFSDVEIPIGHGEHMLRPTLEGRLLQALCLKPTDNILEIGTGCGFLTACLARLGAHVVTVEFHRDLSETARQNLNAQGMGNVTFRVGDASAQWPGDGHFDVIAMSGSLAAVPESFRRQLQIGGRLFAVTGEAPVMEATLIRRVGEDQWAEERLFETSLRALINAGRTQEFTL